jgi:predicted MPP superfamily phosphohydrolase
MDNRAPSYADRRTPLTGLGRLAYYMIMYLPQLAVLSVVAINTAGLTLAAGLLALLNRRETSRTALRLGLAMTGIITLFGLFDWLLLDSLPFLRISFSPDNGPPLFFAFFVRLIVMWGLLAGGLLVRQRARRAGREGQVRTALWLLLIINLLFSLVEVDAYIVEPLLIETTELTLSFEDLDADAPPIRVLHLTDLHISRLGRREELMLARISSLQPDLIVLTGDYVNLSYLREPTAEAQVRQFASQLEAPYGVYAVRGSVEPYLDDGARMLDGTGVTLLEQEAITLDIRGQQLTLVGVACSHREEIDVPRLDRALEGVPDEAFTLLLYHSPDLIYDAAARGIDLYLGGHTHGGQLRLPFYGAMVTGSRFGRQFVAGQFQQEDTTMYISRGLGFEGGGMPRARFLCRPEIVDLELGGR